MQLWKPLAAKYSKVEGRSPFELHAPSVGVKRDSVAKVGSLHGHKCVAVSSLDKALLGLELWELFGQQVFRCESEQAVRFRQA